MQCLEAGHPLNSQYELYVWADRVGYVSRECMYISVSELRVLESHNSPLLIIDLNQAVIDFLILEPFPNVKCT